MASDRLFKDVDVLEETLEALFDPFHEDQLEEAEERGYQEGQTDGLKQGREEGYDEGWDLGVREGKASGYDDGWNAAVDAVQDLLSDTTATQDDIAALRIEPADA